MSKTAELDDLFRCWQERYGKQKIVPDGIIREEYWGTAKRKILFLLKERNKKGNNSDADFRKLVDAGPWPVLGQWAYGLMNTSVDHIPFFNEANNKSNFQDSCRSTAIINLKKTPGVASADIDAVERVVQNDRDLIINELEIIQPKIIVCGGTFRLCQNLFPGRDFKQIVEDDHCYLLGDTIWIDFCHPSIPNIYHFIPYYGLMSVFQNAIRTPEVSACLS